MGKTKMTPEIKAARERTRRNFEHLRALAEKRQADDDRRKEREA